MQRKGTNVTATPEELRRFAAEVRQFAAAAADPVARARFEKLARDLEEIADRRERERVEGKTPD